MEGLDARFTEEEIWSAISQMPSEKAPGRAFYKMCWPIVKIEVVNAFACIYNMHTGPLFKLNGASISLLPKKELAERVQDFRPISLIH